jgi:hypothetical protein
LGRDCGGKVNGASDFRPSLGGLFVEEFSITTPVEGAQGPN